MSLTNGETVCCLLVCVIKVVHKGKSRLSILILGTCALLLKN